MTENNTSTSWIGRFSVQRMAIQLKCILAIGIWIQEGELSLKAFASSPSKLIEHQPNQIKANLEIILYDQSYICSLLNT